MRKAPLLGDNDVISINNSGSSRSTFDASSRPCYHHRSSLPLPLRETLSPRSGTAADSSGLVSLDPPGHQANSGVQVDGVSSSFGAFADSSYLLSESTPSLFPNGGSQLKDLVRAWILQTRDGRSIVSAASGTEHHGDEEVSSCVDVLEACAWRPELGQALIADTERVRHTLVSMITEDRLLQTQGNPAPILLRLTHVPIEPVDFRSALAATSSISNFPDGQGRVHPLRPIKLWGTVSAISSVSRAFYSTAFVCPACGGQVQVLNNLTALGQGPSGSSRHPCGSCGCPSLQGDPSGHILLPFQQLWLRDGTGTDNGLQGDAAPAQSLLVHVYGNDLAGKFLLGDHVEAFGHLVPSVPSTSSSTSRQPQHRGFLSFVLKANSLVHRLPPDLTETIRSPTASTSPSLLHDLLMSSPSAAIPSLVGHLRSSIGLPLPMDAASALLLSAVTISSKAPDATSSSSSSIRDEQQQPGTSSSSSAHRQLHLLLHSGGSWSSAGAAAVLRSAADATMAFRCSSSAAAAAPAGETTTGAAHVVQGGAPGNPWQGDRSHVLSAGALLLANRGVFILDADHETDKEQLRHIKSCLKAASVVLKAPRQQGHLQLQVPVPATAVVWGTQQQQQQQQEKGKGTKAPMTEKARALEEVLGSFDLAVSLDGATPDPDDLMMDTPDPPPCAPPGPSSSTSDGMYNYQGLSAWETAILAAAAAPGPSNQQEHEQPSQPPPSLSFRCGPGAEASRAALRRHVLRASLLPTPAVSAAALALLQRYFKLLRGAQQRVVEQEEPRGLHQGGTSSSSSRGLPAQDTLSLLLRIACASARLCLRAEAGPEDALVAIIAAEQSNALRFGFSAFVVPPASDDMFGTESMEDLLQVLGCNDDLHANAPNDTAMSIDSILPPDFPSFFSDV